MIKITDKALDVKLHQVLRLERLAERFQCEADSRYASAAYRSAIIAGGKCASLDRADKAKKFANVLRGKAKRLCLDLSNLERALNPLAGL